MPQSDRDAFQALVLRVLDGRADDAQRRELDRAVVTSAEARRAYNDVVGVESGLRWLHGGKGQAVLEPHLSLANATPVTGSHRAWVVALCLAASLALVGWFGLERGRSASQTAHAVVGTVRPISGDVRWSFGEPGAADRSELRQGELLMVNRGAAELRLRSGVVAQLESPIVLEMVALDCARVLKGRMTVDVPKGAEGFRVETSAAEVIDLGTTFRVDVTDEGGTDVVVFQGKVDVVPGAADTRAGEGKQRLLKGEGLHVSGDGTLSRIVNVRRDPLTGERPKPVLREVRDNVVRGETRKYYEIVASGMREDASAFVDRQHEWNGVSKAGMPDYLVGGDYVKTFNDDKVTPHLEISLSMVTDATVYLLVDDRLGPSEWLQASFEDTGDDVGIDEAPKVENDSRTLAKEAGRSIDQVHSVWRQKQPGGESLTIKPLEAELSDQSQRGVKSRLNMFGIVVVRNAGN
ncbi:MAG: FecR domain-containing protein [Lacipirellulaceae bacterium]